MKRVLGLACLASCALLIGCHQSSKRAIAAPVEASAKPINDTNVAAPDISADAASVPPTSPVPQYVDLGSRMADLEAAFPADFSCVNYAGGQLCSVQAPQSGECPSPGKCSEASYTVRSGVIKGFIATYDEEDWKHLIKSFADDMGPPQHRVLPAILNMQSEVRYWDGDRGEIAFIHLTGQDSDGDTVDRYSYGYTPEITFGRGDARNSYASTTPDAGATSENDERSSYPGKSNQIGEAGPD